MDGYRPETYGDEISDGYDDLTVSGFPAGSDAAAADFLAGLAPGGLHLTERYGGWLREPFTSAGGGHVSVYTKS